MLAWLRVHQSPADVKAALGDGPPADALVAQYKAYLWLFKDAVDEREGGIHASWSRVSGVGISEEQFKSTGDPPYAERLALHRAAKKAHRAAKKARRAR
jgi:hypothetical protein